MSESESAAAQINRLHEEVRRHTAHSRELLHAALIAAWSAGKLLLAEKKRVRETMGRGAWGSWLEQNFHGSRRNAVRYMRLAETVPDTSVFQGLSLRQVYFQLGIATEPKSRAESVRVAPLPTHVRLATRLIRALKLEADFARLSPDQITAYRQDLRALYERLRPLFDPVQT